MSESELAELINHKSLAQGASSMQHVVSSDGAR